MPAAIEIEHLTKRYNKHGREALSDLNLVVPTGVLFGIVGPDGAGKTTCLRILATTLMATVGSIRFFGDSDRTNPEKVRALVGYMPQDFSLYPDLTVIENLNFFADIHSLAVSAREERIRDLLGFSRLEPFRSRRAEHLSGGMRKKLALACALIHSPRLLLLDEPTTGVDPVSRRELWQILIEIVSGGVTVVLSTPYMDEAERCHQVAMLFEGKLLASGSPLELEASQDFHVLEIERPSSPSLETKLSHLKGILGWRIVGDRIRISTRNVAGVRSALGKLVSPPGSAGSKVRLSKKNMEDLFIALVENKRGEFER
jgi:ABC-2 type transport system ATP-binding protein